MFLVLWEFEVKPECEERFERVYGTGGDWDSLFRRDSHMSGASCSATRTGLGYIWRPTIGNRASRTKNFFRLAVPSTRNSIRSQKNWLRRSGTSDRTKSWRL